MPSTRKSSTKLTGRVFGVHDGDTISIISEEKKYSVRLISIDAPELKQPFGKECQMELARLLLAQVVTIEFTKPDKYGRLLANVYLGPAHINSYLLEHGFAWHYKAYSKAKKLAALEDAAKSSRLGLWATDNPVPPWEFRHAK